MSRLGKRRLNCASEEEGAIQQEKRRNDGLATFRDGGDQQFGDPHCTTTGYFQTANYFNSGSTFPNTYGALESGPAYLVQQVRDCLKNSFQTLPASCSWFILWSTDGLLPNTGNNAIPECFASEFKHFSN